MITTPCSAPTYLFQVRGTRIVMSHFRQLVKGARVAGATTRALSVQASTMGPTLRVGVIGAGGNTRAQHIPKLQQIQGVSIDVVSNRTVQSAQAVAKQFGIPKVGGPPPIPTDGGVRWT